MTDTAIRVLPAPIADHSNVPFLEPLEEEIEYAELVDEATESAPKSNAGRKTVEEREARRAEAELRKVEAEVRRIEVEKEAAAAARRAEAEAKRAPRKQPDTRFSLAVALGIAGVALATSFTVSYAMIVATASWMRLPWEPLAYVVPGFIELLMIFASLDYVITRSRGGKGHAPFLAMWVLASVAVVGGTAHTISDWGAEFGVQWESIVGTVLAAAAPLVVIFVTKRIAALVFIEPER